jgi:intracellular sulfur oxidation DsrE/DsrF family protein
MRLRSVLLCLLFSLGLAAPGWAADKTHRLVIQVTEADPAKYNLVLSNAANVSQDYSSRGEEVEIEILAYGPGLHMLRADTSPVKERMASFRDGMPNVAFIACGNTLKTMAEHERKSTIPLLDGVEVVTTGVARLMQRQEEGWSYVRP